MLTVLDTGKHYMNDAVLTVTVLPLGQFPLSGMTSCGAKVTQKGRRPLSGARPFFFSSTSVMLRDPGRERSLMSQSSLKREILGDACPSLIGIKKLLQKFRAEWKVF